MLDPADAPYPDHVYRNNLRTCEMLGIEPTPLDRTDELIAQWSGAIATDGAMPPITH